jgi:hypothetical protein
MNDDTGRRNRGFGLRTWHVLVALLVLVVGLLAIHVAVQRSKLTRRLAALRAAGYPTTFAELDERNKLPEGAPNGAELYLRAFAAYVPAADDPNLPIVGKAPALDRGVPLPEPMVKAISRCLADNQKCLALLHEAAGYKDARYGWTWKDYAGPMPELRDLRSCVRLLQLAAIFSAYQKDPNATLAYLGDGLRLADSLRRDPVLINYLVRVACVAVVLRGLEESLSVTTFTDGQLQQVQAALTAADHALDFPEALISEQCWMLEACKNPAVMMGGPGVNVPIHLLPGLRGRGQIDTLNYMEDCLAASRLPPAERLAKFREAEKKVEDLSNLHIMIKLVSPALGRVGELDVRVRMHLDLARTALAAERYRLATGKLPDRLEDLVPQYLAQVPIDPFDGQPLRYRLQQPGYLLYSVFEDGQDNGGKERADVGRGDPYDWCFRVTR